MRTIIQSKILEVLGAKKFAITSVLNEWTDTTDLYSQIHKISHFLSSFPNGPVGISCSNRSIFLSLVLATSLAERAVVLFGDKWSINELESQFKSSPCVVLITDHPREINKYTIYDPQTTVYAQRKDRTPDDIPGGCWVGQYTSGTTGRSRLVIRDWEAILDEVSALEHTINVDQDAIFLNMAPVHHSYGFCGGLIWPFLRESKLFLLESFYPSYAKKVWSAISPEVVYGIPFQYHFIANAPGPSIPKTKYAFSAGGPLTREIRQITQERLSIRLTNNYGSTETGTLAIYPHMPPELDSTLVGWPLRGRLIELDKNRQLIVHSKGNMKGYFDGTELGGPYATGDIGEITGDGCIRVEGRIKPVITIGGVKVSTEKIENVLLSMQGVREAVVIPEASDGFYELIKAFIVLEESAVDITEIHIKEYCKRLLIPVEVPRKVVILDELPTSENGKILGKYLAEM